MNPTFHVLPADRLIPSLQAGLPTWTPTPADAHGFYLLNANGLNTRTFDGRNFVTCEPFWYLDKESNLHTIPASATSDGASTPRLIWREIPPFGTYWLAAVFHDWLYRCSGLTKDECDTLFLEAMHDLGVSELEAHTIYEGVHLGGKSSFDEDRKEQAQCKTPSTL